MKNLEEIKDIIAGQKGILATRFKVSEIGVFGSCVRGEARGKSDVDILVSFGKPVDFIEFIRLEDYLAELLGSKVDLVTKNALKPRIGRRILDEVVFI